MIDQINQILNDPDRLREISQIAASMGFTPNEAPTNIMGEIPEDITKALSNVQKKDEKQQALVRALLPYLRPNHQKKLEQAIKIAQITHWAGVTMQARDHTSNKEARDDL